MSPMGFTEEDGEPILSLTRGDISLLSLSESEIFDEEIVAEDLPMEIPDPQFFGIEDNTNLRCHHGELQERKVAFDMAGRRFLANEERSSKKLSFYANLSFGSVSVAVTLATVVLMFFA